MNGRAYEHLKGVRGDTPGGSQWLVCSDRALGWSEGSRPLVKSSCAVCAFSVTDGIIKTETSAETGGRVGWKTVTVWRGDGGHSAPGPPRQSAQCLSLTEQASLAAVFCPCDCGLPGGRRSSWCLFWLLSSPGLRPRHPHVSKEPAESIS